MVPPRIPQFNWIDLGLPSGTLWLDRMVGASSPTENGLFYQWGDTIGHSLGEGYAFSLANYNEKGLNLISSNLDDAHDAARAYYGPEAKMPTNSQFEELISNCVISRQRGATYLITSNINGRSIKIRGNGAIVDLEHSSVSAIRAWSVKYGSSSTTKAWSLHASSPPYEIAESPRYYGFNVMAVHS